MEWEKAWGEKSGDRARGREGVGGREVRRRGRSIRRGWGSGREGGVLEWGEGANDGAIHIACIIPSILVMAATREHAYWLV